MNNNIYFNRKKTFVLNLWGQYQGREKDVGGCSSSRYRMDMEVRCLLYGKRLAIGLSCQNMIASHTDYRVDAETSSYLFDWSPFRVLNLSVSYRLGKRINMKHNKFGINTERL